MQCLGGSQGHCTSQHRPAPALHMLSFENFVKSMPPRLSELKVTPSFCFAFKIPDDVAASNVYFVNTFLLTLQYLHSCGFVSDFFYRSSSVNSMSVKPLVYSSNEIQTVYYSPIILRSNFLRHHFYLLKVIIQVQTRMEYSAG